MLRRSGSMPIHKLENGDTTGEEKEKEREGGEWSTKEQENASQHENEDGEPDTYRASSFARLNRAARDTSLSSFAVNDTNGITLDTYTDLASNCNNSDAREAAALSTASGAGAPAPVFTTIITTPASTAPPQPKHAYTHPSSTASSKILRQNNLNHHRCQQYSNHYHRRPRQLHRRPPHLQQAGAPARGEPL